MRAYVASGLAPNRMVMADVDEPKPGRDEVIVDVRAFSINRGEIRMLGTADDGWRPGWDVAGVVSSESASGPPKGTRVVGIVEGGAWSERVAIRRDALAELPISMSFAQASALPTAGLTALRTLRMGQVVLGRKVLISGASGGVGRFAVQLAKLSGAHVTALVSGGSTRAFGLDLLGAHEVVPDVEQLSGRFDLILESVGGDTLGRLLTMLDPRGTLVMFGNSSDAKTTFDARVVYNGALVNLKGFELFCGGESFARDLAFLVSLVVEDKLDPQLAAEFPWFDLADAVDLLRNRQASGKIALTLSADPAGR